MIVCVSLGACGHHGSSFARDSHLAVRKVTLHAHIQEQVDMPKVATGTLPLSGLFAIVKPSGPTSMSILDKLKPLLAQSRLLVDQEEYKQVLADREKQNKNKKKFKKGRTSRPSDRPKLGQGGTLDPLADGVLGESILVGSPELN
jgi:tRNA pseudouridine55 synthase